jgi:hypothetical protein
MSQQDSNEQDPYISDSEIGTQFSPQEHQSYMYRLTTTPDGYIISIPTHIPSAAANKRIPTPNSNGATANDPYPTDHPSAEPSTGPQTPERRNGTIPTTPQSIGNNEPLARPRAEPDHDSTPSPSPFQPRKVIGPYGFAGRVWASRGYKCPAGCNGRAPASGGIR